MMPLQNTATKVVIKPRAFSAAATATGVIDTLGFEEAAVDFVLDSQDATSSNPAVLKLGEGDTSTEFADITRFVGDATDGFTIPAVQTTPGVTRLNVDLRGRKRWLQLSVTNGDTAVQGCAVATLGKAKDSSIARGQMAGVFDG